MGKEDPWNRKRQPGLVFLSGKFQGQKSLAGYSPLCLQRIRHDWGTEHTCTHTKDDERVKGTWLQFAIG